MQEIKNGIDRTHLKRFNANFMDMKDEEGIK